MVPPSFGEGMTRMAALTWRQRLRSIVGGSAGNLVEWYDWYAYSIFSLYFAGTFFPAQDRTAQLLGAAAVLAVGFLFRPIGALAMGVYADRHGRKAALTLSVTLMCAGSFLIAVIPGYARIGLGAPALLVLARVLQGLSVGGEYGASAVYLSEMADRRRRGFFASFQYVTLVGGQLTALLLLLVLQSVLSKAALDAWGWRVPFALGGVLALGVFRIRRGLLETEAFARARASGERSSGWALFARHPREAVTVMLLTAGGTLAFYAYTTYMQKFLVNTAGLPRETVAVVMTICLLFYTALQPLAGALSDRVGRKPLMVGFGVAGTLLTVPVFTLLERVASPLGAGALVLLLLTILSGYTAISGVVKAELFPAYIRTLGVALPYALANALFGGSAEWVALKLKDVGLERGFYWYVTATILVSLVTFLRMPDTRATSRILED